MHGQAQGHHSDIAESIADLAHAGGEPDAAGNIAEWDQIATVVATAVPARVTDPASTLFKTAAGRFFVEAATSGSLNANVTSGVVDLESSVDNGATWQVAKSTQLPQISVGVADTVDTAIFAVVDLSASIGVLGAKFRLFVTLQGGGGTYTTLIHEGGVIAQELPN